MNGVWGSGFITQIIYASSSGVPAEDPYEILTENNIELLTEDGKNIDIEHI